MDYANPILNILFVGKTDREKEGIRLPLWVHLYDTAEVMLRLWEKWLPGAARELICRDCSEPIMKQLCRFLGFVHDFGKLTVGFQSQILLGCEDVVSRLSEEGYGINNSFGKEPHAKAGEVILLSLDCPKNIASIVGAHHGKPQRDLCNVRPDERYYGESKTKWNSLWKSYFEYSLRECGFNSADELPDLGLEQQIILSGLLIMADWIASNTEYFPLTYSKISPARSEAAWNKLNLPEGWIPEHESMDGQGFPNRFGFPANSVQQMMIDSVRDIKNPGLIILEAQMGAGKTEAALAAAEILADKLGCRGVFFGLPTQATTNGLFPRLIDWAKNQPETLESSVRLAHGTAELNEDFQKLKDLGGSVIYEDDEDYEEKSRLVVHNWLNGRKRVLLSDIVTGTVDQFLMAALKQKHFMLRHIGLIGKVVVIDEVHAYDAYMNRYLDMALKWMGAYGVPVILLSATLPGKRKTELTRAYLNMNGKPKGNENWQHTENYPRLTWTDGKTVQWCSCETAGTEHMVKIQRVTDAKIVSVLKDAMIDGGCACIIMNTVKRAQEMANRLREEMPDYEVVLFHAQYLMPERAEKERELLRRLGKRSTKADRDRLIVVGTQVLEQSLDIDADFMMSDICPMDLLLQRTGRLHRHTELDALRPRRLSESVCFVISPEKGVFEAGAAKIYGEWPLLRTDRLLPGTVRIPHDIPALVNRAYDENVIYEGEEDAKAEFDKRQKNAKNRADIYRIPSPTAQDDLNGFLDGVNDLSEAAAQASVRDGNGSIELIVLVNGDNCIKYLPWENEGSSVEYNLVPAREEQIKIYRQRIRLPAIFSVPRLVDDVIKQLEASTRGIFPEWKNAELLSGELVLLLDDNLETDLCGYKLKYSKENGLIYTDRY